MVCKVGDKKPRPEKVTIIAFKVMERIKKRQNFLETCMGRDTIVMVSLSFGCFLVRARIVLTDRETRASTGDDDTRAASHDCSRRRAWGGFPLETQGHPRVYMPA